MEVIGKTEPYAGASYQLDLQSRYVDVLGPALGKATVAMTYLAYPSWSGTSLAAPFVYEAAGLLRSVYEVDPGEAVAMLRETVTASEKLRGKVASGGTLNAGALLEAAGRPLTLTPTPANGATAVPLDTAVRIYARKRLAELDTTLVEVYEGEGFGQKAEHRARTLRQSPYQGQNRRHETLKTRV